MAASGEVIPPADRFFNSLAPLYNKRRIVDRALAECWWKLYRRRALIGFSMTLISWHSVSGRLRALLCNATAFSEYSLRIPSVISSSLLQFAEAGAPDAAAPELDYCGMLNRVLPRDIRALAWAPVDDAFSAGMRV